jgi:hypothetical protein
LLVGKVGVGFIAEDQFNPPPVLLLLLLLLLLLAVGCWRNAVVDPKPPELGCRGVENPIPIDDEEDVGWRAEIEFMLEFCE